MPTTICTTKYLTISRKTVDFIIGEEVSSPQVYERKYQHPVWPKGYSGITVGLGYDLGYATREEVKEDWSSRVKPEHLQYMYQCCGIIGEEAGKLVRHPNIAAISIPYTEAYSVFIKRSLPKYAKQTLDIYPGVEDLLPDAAGALLSMVYNRGASLEGDRRKEMKAIVPLIKTKNYKGIAAQ